jgi:hypothetical protein|tara:strand:+ start:638 stop:844 length:207 start_codon:yes stop_codon:yes gene_type:complete
MLVEVHHVGDQFQAFDSKGNRITNREILDAIAFEQFPGFKSVFQIDVDITKNPVIITQLDVNINIESR